MRWEVKQKGTFPHQSTTTETRGRRGVKAYREKRIRNIKDEGNEHCFSAFFLCHTIPLKFFMAGQLKRRTTALRWRNQLGRKPKNIGRTVRERLFVSEFEYPCCCGCSSWDNGVTQTSYRCKETLGRKPGHIICTQTHNWYHWLTLWCTCV